MIEIEEYLKPLTPCLFVYDYDDKSFCDVCCFYGDGFIISGNDGAYKFLCPTCLVYEVSKIKASAT